MMQLYEIEKNKAIFIDLQQHRIEALLSIQAQCLRHDKCNIRLMVA